MMRAWIENCDDIGHVPSEFEACLIDTAVVRLLLRGLVDLCGSMLLDLEEVTHVPMKELLYEHARRQL